MPKDNRVKKRVVARFATMEPELQDAVRKAYPMGFTDHMMRIDKGPGNFFYAVVYETDEISYLVKIDVSIDGNIEDEEEKEYYNDDIKGADEIADSGDGDDDDKDDM
jgi:hypothetical protein